MGRYEDDEGNEDDDEELEKLLRVRDLCATMSRGVVTSNMRSSLLTRLDRDVFAGEAAVDWLIAHPECEASTAVEAEKVGQEMLDSGYITRVSRAGLDAAIKQDGPFAAARVKRAFRGGDSIYHFNRLNLAPYKLYVVVRRASLPVPKLGNYYVKLELSNQKGSTRIVSSYSPKWEEEFVFGVEDLVAQQLRMTVVEHEQLRASQVVGVAQVGGLGSLLQFKGKLARATDGNPPAGSSESPAVANPIEDPKTKEIQIPSRKVGDGDQTSAPAPTLTRKNSGDSDESALHRRDSSSGSRGRVASLTRGFKMATEKAASAVRGTRIRSLEISKDIVVGLVQRPFVTEEVPAGDFTRRSSSTVDYDGDTMMWLDLFNPADRESHHRASRGDNGANSEEPIERTMGKLGVEMWISNFDPAFMGRGAKMVNISMKLFEMRGVKSGEERLGINLVSKAKVRSVMFLGGEKAQSTYVAKWKGLPDVDFGGQVVTLNCLVNPETDELSIFMNQKTLDISEKTIASLKIPISSIPYVEDVDDDWDSTAASPSPSLDGRVGSGCDPGTRSPEGKMDRRTSLVTVPTVGLKCERYPLLATAGTFTTKAVKNGDITMIIWMYPSSVGGALLGEVEDGDSQPLSGSPPMALPDPFTNICVEKEIACGYLRLRRALLQDNSPLRTHQYKERGITEYTETAWTSDSGDVTDLPHTGMAGYERKLSYTLPKSAMMASTPATAVERIEKDEPEGFMLCTYTRTPEVPFGSVFTVLAQIVVTKKGPNRTYIRASTTVDFSQRPFIAGQIEGGVKKGTKDYFGHLLEVIENSLSGSMKTKGKRGRVGGGMKAWKSRAAGVGAFVVLVVAILVSALARWYDSESGGGEPLN